MRSMLRLIGLIMLLMIVTPVYPENVYQEPQAFIEEAFENAPPKADKLWLTEDLKTSVKDILGHDMGVLRLRYWMKTGRTVWILEEIGKERPITTGFVVENNEIKKVKILIFRESRGWEVRYPFFTDQFTGASLQGENLELDRPIDGISGATLSVSAVTRLARVALLFHQHVTKGGSS